jgi:N-acetylmuramoyl-L-alanine amidase
MRAWTARLLLVGALVCACPPALATPAGTVTPPRILGVRFGGDPSRTRMVIETDSLLSTRIAAATSPTRITLDLPRVEKPQADADPLDGGGVGLIEAWRIEDGPRGSRLVLDLAGGGQVIHRFVLPPSAAGGSFRYVIDIAPLGDQPPASVVNAAPTPAPTSTSGPSRSQSAARAFTTSAAIAPAVVATRRGRKVIVIDAGHGGHDPGAQGAGLNEKDITLATALALRRRLEREGGYKVVMTRDGDVFIPLETRVQIARRAGADLFISLHADSAGGDPDTHGASIYTLSDHGETRVTEVLGPREWFSRPGARAADPAVGRILLDLTQRSTLNRSALFASLLIDRVSDKIDLLPRTHRDAGYFVLLAPDVPAVLLEMGFISSPRDQARLTDPLQRTRLTNAIAGAIDAYFNGPSPPARATHRTPTAIEASVMTPSPELSPTQAG